MTEHSFVKIGFDGWGVPVKACNICGLYEKPAKHYTCSQVISINSTHYWVVDKDIHFELWGINDWIAYKCAKCGMEFGAPPGFPTCVMVECDVVVMRLALL